MKKILTVLSIMFLSSFLNASVYTIGADDFIVDVPSPTFKNSVGISTTTEPSTPSAGRGYLYLKSDKKLYFKDSDGTVTGFISHVTSDGSSHTFINQDVTTTGTPAFTSVASTITFALNSDLLDGHDYTYFQINPTVNQYNIVIASYPGAGIQYVFDGTDDNLEVQDAVNYLTSGGNILLKGGTLNFTSSVTVTNNLITIDGNGSTIQLQAGMGLNTAAFYSNNVDDLKYKNLNFNGGNLEVSGIYLGNSDRSLVEDCNFTNMGASNDEHAIHAFNCQSLTIHNCKIKDSVLGGANVYVQSGNTINLDGITYNDCGTPNGIGANLYCTASIVTGSNIIAESSRGRFLNLQGVGIHITNFSVDGTGSHALGGQIFINNAGYVKLENGYVNDVAGGHGIDINSTARNCSVIDVALEDIGLGGSNQYDGINNDGDDISIIDIDMYGTIDRYPVYIAGNASDATVFDVNSSGASGMLVNQIIDAGTNTQILMSNPPESNNILISSTTFKRNLTVLGTINIGSGNLKTNAQSAVIKSSTTLGLQGTTPIEEGETYWNTDTNELWIATGTAINQFIHK